MRKVGLDQTLVGGDLAFYLHDGGHGLVPSDWNVYLDFTDRHLKKP